MRLAAGADANLFPGPLVSEADHAAANMLQVSDNASSISKMGTEYERG